MTRLLCLAALLLALAASHAHADECQVRPVPPDPAVQRWEPTARGVGRDLGVPSDLLLRTVWVESRGDPLAVSSAGALGLTQAMRFHWLPGEDWTDPYQAIRKGAGIWRACYQQAGSWQGAAACYGGNWSYASLIFECGG